MHLEEMKESSFNFVSFIWNIVESLRGTYKEEDFRKVMLPMIVISRFDCLLDDYDREIIKRVYEITRGGIILEDYIDAHNYSSNHKKQLLNDKKCGCFYCLRILSQMR
jgi:type I restriction-modification system DNA methylase subunit